MRTGLLWDQVPDCSQSATSTLKITGKDFTPIFSIIVIIWLLFLELLTFRNSYFAYKPSSFQVGIKAHKEADPLHHPVH